MQQTEPESGINSDIEESFHHIELLHSLEILLKPFSDFRGSGFGSLAGSLQQWENHNGEITLKLFLGSRWSNCLRLNVGAVKLLNSFHHALCDDRFYRHSNIFIRFCCKNSKNYGY